MVTDEMDDARYFSELVAGLLNAYFSGIDVKDRSHEMVRQLGIPNGKWII